MGDAGEGLIDADERIQERMDDLERERTRGPVRAVRNPEGARVLESLRLARKELEGQFEATSHDVRRFQLTQAMAEVDRRITEMHAVVNS